jgi:hypothetical protein
MQPPKQIAATASSAMDHFPHENQPWQLVFEKLASATITRIHANSEVGPILLAPFLEIINKNEYGDSDELKTFLKTLVDKATTEKDIAKTVIGMAKLLMDGVQPELTEPGILVQGPRYCRKIFINYLQYLWENSEPNGISLSLIFDMYQEEILGVDIINKVMTKVLNSPHALELIDECLRGLIRAGEKLRSSEKGLRFLLVWRAKIIAAS